MVNPAQRSLSFNASDIGADGPGNPIAIVNETLFDIYLDNTGLSGAKSSNAVNISSITDDLILTSKSLPCPVITQQPDVVGRPCGTNGKTS